MAFGRYRGAKIVINIILLIVLISLGFIFLYPVIYMISTSLMTTMDLISPDVFLFPTEFFILNYIFAWYGLDFADGALRSGIIALFGALGHVVSCTFVGYGFARSRLRTHKLLFMLVVFTFIIPPQTIIIPLFMQFSSYGWINTYWPFIIPALLSQGLKGSLFVIVARQFFAQLPWELDDSARIDGIGGFRIFAQIMLPLSKSLLLIIFLFSFVWHWNDFYLPSIFLRAKISTLSVRLSGFWSEVRLPTFSEQGGRLYAQMHQVWQAHGEGVGMAASFLVIVIPLVLYLALQKFFTESIERTGLVE